jgi:hypothetical protein
MMAAEKGHMKVLEVLLNHGANVNAKTQVNVCERLFRPVKMNSSNAMIVRPDLLLS